MTCTGCARRREWIKRWMKIAYERAVGKRANGGTESAGNVSTETGGSDKPLDSG